MRRRLTQPLVHAWFDLLPPAQQSHARSLHALILAVEPEFSLSVRSGHLVFGYDRAHVLALAPHRQHLHLQIFVSGAALLRFPLLGGAVQGLRQLRVRYGQPYDDAQIRDIVQAVVQAARPLRDAVAGGSGPP